VISLLPKSSQSRVYKRQQYSDPQALGAPKAHHKGGIQPISRACTTRA